VAALVVGLVVVKIETKRRMGTSRTGPLLSEISVYRRSQVDGSQGRKWVNTAALPLVNVNTARMEEGKAKKGLTMVGKKENGSRTLAVLLKMSV
jgi:hypothetical protein